MREISRRTFSKLGAAAALTFSMFAAACTGRYSVLYPPLVTSEGTSDYSREEMDDMLRELANIPQSKHYLKYLYTATCYIPVMTEEVFFGCHRCGITAKSYESEWMAENTETIRLLVEEMRDEGHDVMLEVGMFCQSCSASGRAGTEHSFSIRFADEATYHRVQSSIVFDYRVLLSFLRGESDIGDEVGIPDLKRRLAIIEKMTGLRYE